jgi:carbon-monoxide dehydrogenase large subunit
VSAPLGGAVDTLRFGSGAVVRRVEDPTLVRGAGRFTDDVTLPGQTWLAFVRSDRAHARIAAVRRDDALAVDGVLALWTGADLVAAGVVPLAFPPGFRRPDGQPASAPPRRALAHEFVRFVGEPVAAVVADSRAAAKAAAAAVRV